MGRKATGNTATENTEGTQANADQNGEAGNGAASAAATTTNTAIAPNPAQLPPGPLDLASQLKTFTEQADLLMQQLKDTEQKKQQLLTQRAEEIRSQRVTLKSEFDSKDAALAAELMQIETALGLTSVLDAVVENDVAPNAPPTGTSLQKKKPKDLAHITDDQWRQLLLWPFEGDAKPSSLDNYILLALYNANGQEIDIKTEMAVVQAMGHSSRSNNFRSSISTANTRLKQADLLKSAGRGMIQITAKGRRQVESQMAKATPSGATPGKPETLADYLLVGINKQATHSAPGSVLGKIASEAGFKVPEGTSTDAFLVMLKDSVEALKTRNFVSVEKADPDLGRRESTLTVTDLGKKRAVELSKAS